MTSTNVQGFELRGHTTPLTELIREIWRKRRLIRLLARRDFHVRYRRPSFGLLWIVAVPVMHAAVLSIIFSVVIRLDTGGIPRPVFMLSGLLPWMFFASTLTAAVNSITSGAGLATKVYFPRAMLPLIVVRSNFYGFGPRLAVALAAVVLYGVGIGRDIVLVIPAIALMIALTTAFSLVLAALQVYFRDTSFILKISIQAWFYASGVFFPIDRVPEGILRTAVMLNPGAGMVHLFRSAIVSAVPDWSLVLSVVVWTIVLMIVASILYWRFDRVFVDLL